MCAKLQNLNVRIAIYEQQTLRIEVAVFRPFSAYRGTSTSILFFGVREFSNSVCINVSGGLHSFGRI